METLPQTKIKMIDISEAINISKRIQQAKRKERIDYLINVLLEDEILNTDENTTIRKLKRKLEEKTSTT